MTKKSTDKKGAPTKPRHLALIAFDVPADRGDSNTIVDWVNDHAKLKWREGTVASAHNILRDWWVCESELKHDV